MADNLNIQTQANLNPSIGRMKLGATSQFSLSTQSGKIYEQAKKELLFPQRNRIYRSMNYDPNITAARSLIDAMITRGNIRVEIAEDAPEEEKKRCEMLQYNLLMLDRPWEEYPTEFMTYLQYGFNPVEKLYQKMETPLGDFIGWKDFRTISQDTVDDWFFDVKTGDLKGLRQNTSLIHTDSARKAVNSTGPTFNEEDVPRKKFMLFRNRTTRNNPEGTSSYDGCYLEWKYRGIANEIQSIGISKDLQGVPEIGIDAGFLAKAAADPSSDEAANVEIMKQQAANLQKNEQGYIITPIAYNEQGKPLFYTKLLGIEGGGGRSVDTIAAIKEHDKKILMTFLADVLALGKDGSGSFAMSDNLLSLLEIGVEYHLKNIVRTLNHDLIRQTYELNKWEYDPRTACKFVFDPVAGTDLDALGSFIQRVFAVGAVRPSTDVENMLRNKIELPDFEGSESQLIVTEEPMQSRAGDGMTSGLGNGTGDSTSSGGDRSSGNKSNK